MLIEIIVIPYGSFKEKIRITKRECKRLKGYIAKDRGTYLEYKKFEGGVEDRGSKLRYIR